MKVLDKFLDIMKLSDDDDYDDDFFDEEELEEYDRKPKKRSFKREREVEEEEFDFQPEPRQKSSRSVNTSKVTPMRQPASRSTATGNSMEVCVIKPSSVNDSREISETLLSGRTVILNLEGLDIEIAQRIVDFISGAAFAIDGNLQKVSNYIFLLTPTNVDISGDLQDLLNTGTASSFDVASVRTRF